MANKKTILVAPLNWGLGHATRCIPIINELLAHNYQVLLASDGAALSLLQKEFPHLPSLELPDYKITYAQNARGFKWKLASQALHILRAAGQEKKIIRQLVATGQIHGIISDNRLGVRHKKVPSVYVTHQLEVLSGATTWLTTRLHRAVIKKHNACWVPDTAGSNNLSGRLGHPKKLPTQVSYLGILSRMKKTNLQKKYDIAVLLSGPEPQRSLLEVHLKKELQTVNKKIVFVLGKMDNQPTCHQENHFVIYNYLTSQELEQLINQSELVISRSGYTTLMDLATLEKKAFFIPTPGQYEQEYLAKRLQRLGIAPQCSQAVFTAKELEKTSDFKGLTRLPQAESWSLRFKLFEGK